MRFRRNLCLGVSLLLVVVAFSLKAEASGGLFSRHHGDCDANHSVVRLPAQQIRVETARPRIVVQESHFASRGRFAFGASGVPFVPTGPIVASFLVPPTVNQEARSSASNVLRAAQDLEAQAFEVNRLRAAHQAEINALDQVHQRIAGSIQRLSAPPPAASAPPAAGATSTEISNLTAEIEKLSKRISDVERLLLIHDDLLEKAKLKKKD